MSKSSGSRQYQYESRGIVQGPVSGRALKALAAAGKILPTDMVWEYGTDKRYLATKVRGLFPESNEIVTATLVLDDAPTGESPFMPGTPFPALAPTAPAKPPARVLIAAPVQPAASAPGAAPVQPAASAPQPAHRNPPNSTKNVVLAKSPRDVFISYSSKDKTIADAICGMLEAERIRCWIAPRDIRPGQEYAESILNAINASRMMVIVLSASSNASPHVLREVERGVSKGIPVIPFRVEDIKPSKSLEFFLSAPHWLDALTTPLEDHIKKLITVARTILEANPDDPDRALGGAQHLATVRRAPRRRWALRLAIASIALGLLIAFIMLWRGVGPNPLDSELAEFKRNLDLGNGSVVFLSEHATSRFPEWLQQAERGNPIGQLFVGRCYQEGLVVAQDPQAAMEWLRKSATKGNSFAQVALAYGYSDGIGVERNMSEALRWNMLAADQGNSTAMRNIGFLYAEGLQGKPELDKALEWLKRGAEAGNTVAMRKVGDYYAFGHGVEKDLVEAQKWYDRALAAGDVWQVGKKLGDEFSQNFTQYLDAKSTAAQKTEALTALQAKLPELKQLKLNGMMAFFSASNFYASITGLQDLPKSDPLRVVHDEIIDRLMVVYSPASASEKANNLADFTRAVDPRLESLHGDKKYVELTKIWEQCYQGLKFDQLRKTDEWNSLVRQVRFLSTALIKQGQRKEAEELIAATTKQCQVWLKERPWDWYLKDAYTGVCFDAAEAWFETGDVELIQPLLLQGWTIRLKQFGKEELLPKYTGRLPRRGQVPSGATDEERVFFERFIVEKKSAETEQKGQTAGGKNAADQTAASGSEAKKSSGTKRFTVPIDFSGKKYPFHVYVMTGPRGYAEVQDQFRWVEEVRGGKVPQDVRDSFRRLNEIAKENNVDFMELTVYALGTANAEGGGGTGGESSTNNSGASGAKTSGTGGTGNQPDNPSRTSANSQGSKPTETRGAFGDKSGVKSSPPAAPTKANSPSKTTSPPAKNGPSNTFDKAPSPPAKNKTKFKNN